ncbi:MAG: four-carbon acid sugar kinase family protein [Paracoccaceae bacterium]|nr:four-carbon acid sugar kinase family protein [Paracoccaceae bacterium]
MKLGAICDDFTGTSDLGLTLAAGGMRVIQFVGIPDGPAPAGVDGGLISLKSRSAPVDRAVAQSLAAWRWLRDQGCEQILFKYCSTFDSTPEGNIGPVIDALIEATGTRDPVIVCPAFPATGRTVYQGHLFVGDRLLSETGMRDHPITPMTDPDLRRWLGRQTRRPVGHLPLATLRAGQAREGLLAEAAAGRQIVVCDAVEDEDLRILGRAAAGFALITGGSGIALALPERLTDGTGQRPVWAGLAGPAAVLSGSCSEATRRQIATHLASGGPARKIAMADLISGHETPETALAWVLAQKGLPVVYSSDDPAAVRENQQRYGAEKAAAVIEDFFGRLARLLVGAGVTRLISAGGETSGAVIGALEARELEIGPMIAPGVPALRLRGRDLVIALKSGNFGGPDFFAEAAAVLQGAGVPA